MNLILCKLKKLIYASFKKLKKHGFDFLQVSKSSETWIEFFCKLKKLKRDYFFFFFFASSKKMDLIFYIKNNIQKNICT